MKNKLFTALNLITVIVLTFSIIATTGVILLNKFIKSPDYCLSQIESTNTYENAYNYLMKKFKDSYSITSIPLEVYEKSFTKDWVKKAINDQVRSSFENMESKTNTVNFDYSKAEENITAYFENYAHENHVIKDDLYLKRLDDSIVNAKKTAESAIDVYKLTTIKKAGIWSKVGKIQQLSSKLMLVCIIVTVVLAVIPVFLKNPVYWLGTAFFSSGLIMMVPVIYVKATKFIMKFSIKEFTTYTLMTGIMNNSVNLVLYISIAAALIGVVLIALGIILMKRKASSVTIEENKQ